MNRLNRSSGIVCHGKGCAGFLHSPSGVQSWGTGHQNLVSELRVRNGENSATLASLTRQPSGRLASIFSSNVVRHYQIRVGLIAPLVEVFQEDGQLLQERCSPMPGQLRRM